MGEHSIKINKILNSIIFSLVLFLCCSCSQNLPEISQANGTIIFEYDDEQQLPESRLSVFVESESNPRRFYSMKVRSLEKDFEWETNDVLKIQNNEKCYAGYTNFVVPEGQKIPNGKYTIIYLNADEEEANAEFTLNYNSKLYELKASEIPAFMKKRNAENKIAIYNKDQILIFFGNRTNDYKTTRDIWYKFSDADYFNDIWITSNNDVICVLPKELVQPDKVE